MTRRFGAPGPFAASGRRIMGRRLEIALLSIQLSIGVTYRSKARTFGLVKVRRHHL